MAVQCENVAVIMACTIFSFAVVAVVDILL